MSSGNMSRRPKQHFKPNFQAEFKRQYEQAQANSFKGGGKVHDENDTRENAPKGRIGFY